MLARQAALLTPTRSSHPRRLPSCQHIPHVNPLAATLMHLPASVANKRLTVELSPLAATLTKTGGGGSRGAILHFTVHSTLTSHLPYALPSSVSRKSFACRSYENTGGVGDSSHFGTLRSPLGTYQSQQFRTLCAKRAGWGEHFVD
jgi:hypothetical protein